MVHFYSGKKFWSSKIILFIEWLRTYSAIPQRLRILRSLLNTHVDVFVKSSTLWKHATQQWVNVKHCIWASGEIVYIAVSPHSYRKLFTENIVIGSERIYIYFVCFFDIKQQVKFHESYFDSGGGLECVSVEKKKRKDIKSLSSSSFLTSVLIVADFKMYVSQPGYW